MASGILENDTMFSANNIRPWHPLGKVIKDAPSSDKAIEIAGLDWSVEQVQIYAGTKPVEGLLGNIRSDTKDCLGIITKRYSIVQNKEAFAFIDDIVGDGCVYETAGSLWNGKRVWMLVKMPETNILGDAIENYLCFTNSHDGISAVKVCISNIRVVCNNTLTLALSSAQRMWSFRHMGDIQSKKQEAAETLDLASKYLLSLSEKAEDMVKKSVDIDKFILKLLPVTKDMSKRKTENAQLVRDAIVSIHNNKDDLGNFRKTSWGVYNAVADFVSNSEPLRKTATMQENKFLSFVDGNDLLLKAQKILNVV